MKQIILILLAFFVVSLSYDQGFAYQAATNKANVQIVAKLHKVQQQPKATKKQSTALILAAVDLFLPIGLQRYYLGYTTIGIIMTVLTITGIGLLISWLWTLIDLIRIANGSLKPADGSDYVDLY